MATVHHPLLADWVVEVDDPGPWVAQGWVSDAPPAQEKKPQPKKTAPATE